MGIKQVDAVISVVTGLEGFVPGVKLTGEQRAECVKLLVSGLMSGEIEMSAEAKAKYSDEKSMKTYAGGLLTNWLNKSPVLNGGVKYEAKNPGSRSGSEEYKQALALKKYLIETGTEIPAELEQFIAEHAPVKVEKKKEVDVSALPEGLRKLVG
jgi:hypothetical protein